FTHTTVGAVPPPVALMVVASMMLGRLIVHVRPAASADAAMAALISVVRSTPVRTPPTVPEPLFEKVAPEARRTLPVTNSLPVMERCPLGPMQMSPTMPAVRSVSVHGVLTFGVHFPLVVSQPPLH